MASLTPRSMNSLAAAAMVGLLACGDPAPAPTPTPAPAVKDDARRADLERALADGRQLAQLKIPGSGEGFRYRLTHSLTFPSAEAADSGALAATAAGLRVVEDEGESGESWTVDAWEEVMLSPKSLAQRRVELEALAQAYGGEYEGWDAERLAPLAPPPTPATPPGPPADPTPTP